MHNARVLFLRIAKKVEVVVYRIGQTGPIMSPLFNLSTFIATGLAERSTSLFLKAAKIGPELSNLLCPFICTTSMLQSRGQQMNKKKLID